LKVDFHHFETQTDLEGSDSDDLRAVANNSAGAFFVTGGAGTNGAGTISNSLGEEIDVTLVHKYDSNTKIVLGYSVYFTTMTHAYLNGSGGTAGRDQADDQEWGYVMIDTKF